jgi:hypothetical protein
MPAGDALGGSARWTRARSPPFTIHSLEQSANGTRYDQNLLEQSADRNRLFTTWFSLWIPRSVDHAYRHIRVYSNRYNLHMPVRRLPSHPSPSSAISFDPQRTSIVLPSPAQFAASPTRHTCPSTSTLCQPHFVAPCCDRIWPILLLHFRIAP